MNYEEKLEKTLENNAELKKVFDEHPERKELYLQKMKEAENESWGCGSINPKFCQSCMFSHGEAPFADAPEKAYCMIYNHENGEGKPPEVYYDGKECEYYNKAPEK